MKLQAYVERQRDRVDRTLEELLPAASGPASTVARAMRYAVMSGGKRLRPVLALAAGEACGGDTDAILEPSTALELLHTYSLIHDDLPAMDDDDLRRGRPTLHKEFDEAVAILAGDALHTLAFQILAERPGGQESALRRLEASLVLARAAGIEGMVGGQVADLEAEGHSPGKERLNWIHRHKTGALLAASVEIGAIHAGAGEDARQALAGYGLRVGLAFQIADDILDCTGTAEGLGKTPGKDRQSGKATYPSMFGLEESRRRANALIAEALERLEAAGLRGEVLEGLARYAVERQR